METFVFVSHTFSPLRFDNALYASITYFPPFKKILIAIKVYIAACIIILIYHIIQWKYSELTINVNFTRN